MLKVEGAAEMILMQSVGKILAVTCEPPSPG